MLCQRDGIVVGIRSGPLREQFGRDAVDVAFGGALGRHQRLPERPVRPRHRPQLEFREVGGLPSSKRQRMHGSPQRIDRPRCDGAGRNHCLLVALDEFGDAGGEKIGVGRKVMQQRATAGASPALARYGEPTLIRPRLGQGAFRVLVTDVYHRRCAITGERTLPALEAAHIRPYAEGGSHEARNGLLMRRDIHSLFDAGYVTVTPSHHFEVSRRIREEFDNGRHYYDLHGRSIESPDGPRNSPDPVALAWHNEHRFLG